MNWNRIKLIALMTIIFVPISSATWLFVRSEGMEFSGNTTNRGTLITPVLDITELGLMDSDGSALFQRFEDSVANIDPANYDPRPWMLVYLGSESCDEVCIERLYFLRQLHRRLGSDERRVERWYAVVGDSGLRIDQASVEHFETVLPRMKLAASEEGRLRETLSATHAGDADPIAEHYIYLVDPVGNVMLYFTPEQGPEDILTDLNKLLDQSSLG